MGQAPAAEETGRGICRMIKAKHDEAQIQSRICQPKNCQQVLRCADAELWNIAIKNEMDGLSPAVRLPAGKLSIERKMVLN